MKIGTMVHLDENVCEKIKDVKAYGMQSFQLCCWNHSFFTDEMAREIKRTADEQGLEISAVWCVASSPSWPLASPGCAAGPVSP